MEFKISDDNEKTGDFLLEDDLFDETDADLDLSEAGDPLLDDDETGAMTSTEIDLGEEEIDDEDDYELEDDDVNDSGVVGKIKDIFDGLKRKKKVDEDDIDNRKEPKEDDEDEDEDDDENENKFQSFINKQLPFLAKLKKSKKDDSDDDVEEDDEEDDESEDGEKKPKRKIKIKPIYAIIAILGVGALMFDESDFVDTPPPASFKKPVRPKRPSPPPQPEPAPEIEQTQPEVNETDSIPESIPEPEAVEINEPEQVSEPEPEPEPQADLNEIKVEEESNEPVVVEEPIEEVKSDNVEMVDLSNEIEDMKNEEVETESDTTSDTNSEESSEETSSIDNSTSRMDDTSSSNAFDSLGMTEVSQPEVSTDITQKLLEDLEVKLKEEQKEIEMLEVAKPVGQPTYESIGRGLVYNCADGHWACIDVKGYQQCRENYSWNKTRRIPIECYPFAILDNDLDCASVQQEKIDGVSKTNFCK